ncbi:uncharacterized protein B0T23DRAFT_408049 [Neurospora hispaniola]|uniref:SAP domain-containing protein n=1 Tax=Neurospora hispaniola TaxID=588809 RepID=A0AAJ0HZK9_9PEZI|nr:hypothetical protein B0T23DRAFT_408049 [Neurospora hispaniola]
MPHPLEEWLPNDAPWATLSTAVLKKQCTIRNLPTTGHSKDLVQRLSAYSQAKMKTSDTKRHHPWLTEPVNRASYEIAAYVLRFVLNCPEPYSWQRALLPSELRTIYQHSHASRALGPLTPETHNSFCIFCFRDHDATHRWMNQCEKCTRVMHHVCRQNAEWVRIPVRKGMCWICYEDIKWNIEKFCWKNRGLPAAHRITPPVPARTYSAAEAARELIQHKEPKDDVSKTSSLLSNKDSKKRQLSNTQSTNRRFPSVLSSKPPSSSTSPALKSTVNQVVPYLVDGLRQGHRKSKIITLKLSKKGAALSTSSPNNEPTPLPGNPALIWQETQKTREQQRQENERHQAALPNLSPAPDHILSAVNPGGGNMEPSEVAPAPNAAIVPAEDPTSPRACSSAAETSVCTATTATPQRDQGGATSISARDVPVGGGKSQPPQVSVTTASTTESADATGAQDTTSITTENPTSASAPVPTDHSTSGPTHAHSALDLVQECSRLAKKSTQIRKKSEREAKRMEKKHRRELEKTKRKSKKEVKRLEKKIESLEKEVLKALAGPE